jgi:Tol biopolymer transport system component
MKLTLGICLLALTVILTNCKEDDNKPYLADVDCSYTPCANFPEDTIGGVSIISLKDTQCIFPCFNPNIPNEFVYIKKVNKTSTLIKTNLQTDHEEVLWTERFITGQPDWGKNSLILFSASDYQVRLIDLNANNSLKKQTTSYTHLYPKWFTDTSFICHYSFNLGIPYYLMTGYIGRATFDTVKNYSFVKGSISSNGNFAFLEYADALSISVKSSNGIQKLPALEDNGRNRITGLCWPKNSDELFYSTYRNGVWKVNMNTKEFTLIRNGCQTRSYRDLSISADGKKIIVERVDATDYIEHPGSWTEEAKIVNMDIDGCNEKVLFE